MRCAAVGPQHSSGRTEFQLRRATLQIELLNRRKWTTVAELSHAIADWIENFYNPARRHSALNYLTPSEFEALHLSPIEPATLP